MIADQNTLARSHDQLFRFRSVKEQPPAKRKFGDERGRLRYQKLSQKCFRRNGLSKPQGIMKLSGRLSKRTMPDRVCSQSKPETTVNPAPLQFGETPHEVWSRGGNLRDPTQRIRCLPTAQASPTYKTGMDYCYGRFSDRKMAVSQNARVKFVGRAIDACQ